MSFCSNCGSAMNDGDQFCQVCGQPAGAQQQPAYPVPSQTPYNPGQTPYQPVQTPYNPTPYNGSYVYRPERPMNWFKFLIYFSLFAGAVLNAINGILMLTGAQYGSDAADVYAMMPSLKTVDTLFGLTSIATAALQIYTRFQLSGFKRNALTFLTACYGIVAALSLAYLLAASTIINDFANTFGVEGYALSASDFSSILSPIVFCVINYVYFKKRADLFVN